tara:strand:+ start:401 stop:688 length:288 start_codon:yes stop_codon:yes gene_type:complete
MFSPVTLSRIFKNKSTRFYGSYKDVFLNSVERWLVDTKPNPLGRWCHQESDIYKNTCKPLKKIDLANLDNDAAYHNDEFDVAAHLEMYKEFEKRN